MEAGILYKYTSAAVPLVTDASWAECVVRRNKAKWQSQIYRYSLQLCGSNKSASCTTMV